MPTKTTKTQDNKLDIGYVSMYYQNQYDRIAKLENLRLSITNVVITLSVVSFTFSFSGAQPLNKITGVILPILLIISNLFAIIYIAITYQTISVHLRRAKTVLIEFAPELNEISKKEPTPRWTNKFSLAHNQLLFHLLLIVLSSLPIWIYLSTRKP
jgi:hypothetical protein